MSELTFAEAMALDPSEVEIRCPEDHCWGLLSERIGMKLSIARVATFRRAKPKRSRVQEMAGVSEYDHRLMASTIRAVCEWLRVETPCILSAEGAAKAIERTFLEPR